MKTIRSGYGVFFIILMAMFLVNPDHYCSAQDDSLKTDELIKLSLDEILDMKVVGASKYEQNLMDVPATVTVLNMENLSVETKTNLAEMLRTVPGVTVYRNQGDSPWYRVSMRGLNDNFLSSRTLVTIDGAPFYNPHGGGVDLSWLPITNIESVEIIKGTFSTLYGANAFGGMVNIVTKKGISQDEPDQESKTELSAQVSGRENLDNDSAEGFAISSLASHSGGSGEFSWHFSAEGLTDDGNRENYQLTPSFMGPQSRLGLFDDELEQQRYKFTMHLNMPLGFSFSGFYTRDNKDVLGFNDGIDDRIFHAALAHSRPLSDRYDYQLRIYYQRFDQEMEATETFRFAENNPFPGAHFIDQPFFYDLSPYKIGGEFQNRFQYSDALKLVFGADFRHEASKLAIQYRGGDGSLGSFGYSKNDVQDYGAYIQAEYQWDRFSFLPGIRYDNDSKSGSFVSGKLAGLFHLDDDHTIYGVAGWGFRSPNFNERFVNVFGKTGTEDLKPEKTLQFEAGVKNRLYDGKISWNLSVFHTLADDYIDTDLNRVYQNTEGVTVWGGETEFSWKITPEWRANANFTAIIGEHDEDGEEIPMVSDYKWSAGIAYDAGTGWTGKAMIRGEADKILGEPRGGHVDADGYEVVDVSFGRRFMLGYNSRLTVLLFVDNLFDEHYVEAWPGSVSTDGGRSDGITPGIRVHMNF